MIKKSKVTSAQPNGTWEGKFGLMYKNEISFENGDSGEYSSKTREQDKFVVGQETEYEFIDGKFPKIKPVYQNNFNSGSRGSFAENPDKQRVINRWAGLGRAIDYYGDNQPKDEVLFQKAETFIDWATEKPTEKTSVKTHFENMEKAIDDLPF